MMEAKEISKTELRKIMKEAVTAVLIERKAFQMLIKEYSL